MECVTSVGRRNKPFVVRLMEMLVDPGVVKASVSPVDAEIGEENEEGILRIVVPLPGALLGPVIQLAVATSIQHEQRGSTQSHSRHSLDCLLDLKRDLVLEKPRVVKSSLVEDEDVRKRSTDEVQKEAKHPSRFR